MKTFKTLFDSKMKDNDFRCLFEKECHICPNTLKIFDKIEKEKIMLEDLARQLQIDIQALRDLENADYCDPGLVVLLCNHLGIAPPSGCRRHEQNTE